MNGELEVRWRDIGTDRRNRRLNRGKLAFGGRPFQTGQHAPFVGRRLIERADACACEEGEILAPLIART